MNRNHHLQLNGLILTSVVFVSAAVAPVAALAETSLQKAGAAAPTNSAAIEIPHSTFVIPTRPSDGRDPFFPLSRRLVVETQPDKGADIPKVAPVSLTLKGISRNPDNKRFALINDKTFASGEEGEVVMNNSRFRIHCIEIKEDSVVVEVNGARQELRMRPGTI